MALTPIPGVTRLRKFQLGPESTFKTQVPATRRMPWSFVPDVNPNWTNVTADTGTLTQALPPYRAALDITGPATGQLFFNDLPALLLYGVGPAGVTPTGGGSAKTWTFAPSDTTQDSFDTATGEWFDDATADAFAFTGGVVNDFSLSYPQSLGPVDLTANWRFAALVTYPATPTAGLSTDPAPVPVYAADTTVSINDSAGTIGVSPFTNQVYDTTVSVNNNLDIKRFINGSNTRFDVANYGRGERMLEVTFTFAKATAAIAETAKWLNANPQERFVEINTVSTALAQAATPYQFRIRFSGFWFTRTNTEINTNTGFQLVCRNRFDSAGLNYPFQFLTVNTLATVLAA